MIVRPASPPLGFVSSMASIVAFHVADLALSAPAQASLIPM